MSKPRTLALPGRILVADDLADAAQSLAMLFELYGAEVRVALDGNEAVRVAESFLPEIVLLDISMPGLSGYEAARILRQAPWGREMILVALTGWGRSTDLEKAAAAGFDGHLLKPVEPEALLEVISRLRKRRRSRPPGGADGPDGANG